MYLVTMIDAITVGCTITGKSFSGDEIRGEVIGMGRKNGKRVFDIRDYEWNDNRWLYDYQITQVIFD